MRFRFRSRLQGKLFVLFSVIIILPLIFCSFFISRQSMDIVEKNTGSAYIARLDFFSDRFRLIIEKFYQDLLNTAVNRTVRNLMFAPMNVTDDGYAENMAYLAFLAGNMLFTDNMIHSVVIYSRERNWLFVSSNATSNIYTGDLSGLEWLGTAAGRDRGVYMTASSSVSPRAKANGEKVISLFVSVVSMRNYLPAGYISVNLDIKAVQSQLLQNFLRDNPSSVIITDSEGGVISGYGRPVTLELLGRICAAAEESGGQGYYHETIKGEKFLVSYSAILPYRWKVFVLTPYRQIIHQNRMITGVVFLVIAIFILLSTGIAWILSINLLSPLQILFGAMRRVKDGELDCTIPLVRKDEIGLLYDGFNEMSKNLASMMEKLYQDELVKKDLRLKMMGYQINAHFLYNTLDAIHWMARINKVPQITSLVSSLVSYFRIALSEGQDIITIEQVIQMAESYMNIYTIKSDFIVDFVVNIDRTLYGKRTLKYIFQPLLENALNHGIEGKADSGIVELSCTPEGDDLVFTVSDTGAGIPPEKLKDLRHSLEKNDMNEVGNFALRNVNMQIKIHYGNRYGLNIESVPGAGTKVYVRVPVLMEEDHVQAAGL
ncbi:MAG: histidine kinase [Treponema sp.]|nr:histidine kinase [Treponema sp.]